jgi:hypothetical protein
MGGKEAEACGRCSMSTVVEVADGDADGRDPFGEERIEVPESQLRKVSPAVWLGAVKRRVDDWATRVTYGR